MNSNPSKEDIIGWSLSDDCSRTERHLVDNTQQPFDAQVWSCLEVNCKGHTGTDVLLNLTHLPAHFIKIGKSQFRSIYPYFFSFCFWSEYQMHT
jgi:hypothetical protein